MNAFDPTPLRPNAPAFPMQDSQSQHAYASSAIIGIPSGDERDTAYIQARSEAVGGLTARQHAAIALCVPDSGCDWLDAMIEQRRRDEFIRATLVCVGDVADWPHVSNESAAEAAVLLADAALAATKKGADHGRPD